MNLWLSFLICSLVFWLLLVVFKFKCLFLSSTWSAAIMVGRLGVVGVVMGAAVMVGVSVGVMVVAWRDLKNM